MCTKSHHHYRIILQSTDYRWLHSPYNGFPLHTPSKICTYLHRHNCNHSNTCEICECSMKKHQIVRNGGLHNYEMCRVLCKGQQRQKNQCRWLKLRVAVPSRNKRSDKNTPSQLNFQIAVLPINERVLNFACFPLLERLFEILVKQRLNKIARQRE